MVSEMRALKRTGLVVAVLLVAGGAFALWYVYGAWPVPDGYEFPRHSLLGGPQAGLAGTLVEEDGCIRIRGDRGGGVTVVWPPGYSLSVEAGRPVVHGGSRNIGMGQQVLLGGGQFSRAQLHEIGSAAATTPCPEPLFLTTGFAD
jgi:hypothetical protein